jgi:hypothetical protein
MTYEERWARRDAKLKERLADIPSRFTNEALYEERPVGVAVQNAEQDFFGTSFTVFQQQVRKAAKTVAYQWPGVLDAEEAEQELWVQLMESPGSVAKLRDEFTDQTRVSALISMGHQIANKTFTANEIAAGNFRYSVNQVKDILKQSAERERNPEAKPVMRSALKDLEAGMQRLKDKNAGYADAIVARYRNGKVPARGADTVKLSRALTALTTNMNRAHKQQHVVRPEGPGTRKIISTEHAKAISHKQYNGEAPYPSPGQSPAWTSFMYMDTASYK